MIPLSKTMEPSDLLALEEALLPVDSVFTLDQPQSEWRRWEYGLAVEAIDQWEGTYPNRIYPGPHRLVDVGGAGSPFWRMTAFNTEIVDPDAYGKQTLAAYLATAPPLAPIVTCLSVIEHVDDLSTFLYHLACLTAPGGLLVITTDMWDRGLGPDTSHFHWMRQRIFTPGTLYVETEDSVAQILAAYGFDFFGGYDPIYHGDQLYGPNGYTFASLVMRKRP